jgi:putative endonuclease
MATEPAACPRACFFGGTDPALDYSASVLVWEIYRAKLRQSPTNRTRRAPLRSTLGRLQPTNSHCMLPVHFTQIVVRSLDWLARRVLAPESRPRHQQTGSKGEEDAFFYLRRQGYTMIARNYRTPRCRGEIDLIGWDADILCFIEVKTRTSRDVRPPQAAVDRHKRREVAAVARQYLRHLPPSCQWRFDIVSVYYERPTSRPQIEVFQNASLSA